jgi:hypothetical protein
VAVFPAAGEALAAVEHQEAGSSAVFLNGDGNEETHGQVYK